MSVCYPLGDTPMKKTLAALAVASVFALAACGDDEN
jgi:hypothetical protein